MSAIIEVAVSVIVTIYAVSIWQAESTAKVRADKIASSSRLAIFARTYVTILGFQNVFLST